MSSIIASFWRRISKNKEFVEGARINFTDFSYVPFQNNYRKLAQMHEIRFYHYNNTPYQFQKEKYAREITYLHRELNFLNSRLFMKRIFIVFVCIGLYNFLFMKEFARDWRDTYNIKFHMKGFGDSVEAAGEGSFVDD
jgi:hypothetical protein